MRVPSSIAASSVMACERPLALDTSGSSVEATRSLSSGSSTMSTARAPSSVDETGATLTRHAFAGWDGVDFFMARVANPREEPLVLAIAVDRPRSRLHQVPLP
jgi:hypothetical protein